MQLLSQADGPEQRDAVAAAMRNAIDARRAMEQAVTSGKALASPPDTATDRLHRAIDKVSEVERSLRQLNPPIADVGLDAARAHLAEAASAIDAVEGRLAPFDE
ncbi:hypothetical protein [Indioceanicola profundi]|uniref:hypothetical protein n=1 Tax=Indioceanicola profundi TaxID=2220096 RepID=UPI0013C4886C|nr:hypothetical protein [Indioceanicola profundi]